MKTFTTTSAGGGRDEAAPEAVASRGGVLSRLGRWTAGHLRAVLVAWAVVLVVFGVFAPRVESALAGAGWQDSTSQSVAARDVIGRNFAGLGSTALQVVVVDHQAPIASDPAAQQVVAAVTARLKADRRVSTVVPPTPGMSLSVDGRTGIVTAGAGADPNAMVRAAGALARPLAGLSRPGVSVALTGDSALWANFNSANHSAMMRSEMLSWPVTLVILVIAFGSLVAAGLPLMLTMAGLLVAAGALVMATAVAPVSIWALNFALMFALALGIDYALFIVIRFRAALARRGVQPGDRAGGGGGGGGDVGHRRQGGGVLGAHRAGLAGRHLAGAEPGVSVHGAGHHAGRHRRLGRHLDPAAGGARPARYPGQRRPCPAAPPPGRPPPGQLARGPHARLGWLAVAPPVARRRRRHSSSWWRRPPR